MNPSTVCASMLVLSTCLPDVLHALLDKLGDFLVSSSAGVWVSSVFRTGVDSCWVGIHRLLPIRATRCLLVSVSRQSGLQVLVLVLVLALLARQL